MRPLLFTIIYLGFTPRIALERADSGEARINKITKLIKESKYAIHDLSRLKSEKKGEFYRLNMPFELGLDIGCKIFRGKKWRTKKCLILEKERYRYQKALSDLSNSDIYDHKNEPAIIVRHVRNWLVGECGAKGKGPREIWYHFNDFMTYLYERLKGEGFNKRDIDALSIKELLSHMKVWLNTNIKP
jgi:hypothetical protein